MTIGVVDLQLALLDCVQWLKWYTVGRPALPGNFVEQAIKRGEELSKGPIPRDCYDPDDTSANPDDEARQAEQEVYLLKNGWRQHAGDPAYWIEVDTPGPYHTRLSAYGLAKEAEHIEEHRKAVVEESPHCRHTESGCRGDTRLCRCVCGACRDATRADGERQHDALTAPQQPTLRQSATDYIRARLSFETYQSYAADLKRDVAAQAQELSECRSRLGVTAETLVLEVDGKLFVVNFDEELVKFDPAMTPEQAEREAQA